MSTRDHLTARLESLLEAHDALIGSMHNGQHVPNAPSRLLKINARIHETYRRLTQIGGGEEFMAVPVRREDPLFE